MKKIIALTILICLVMSAMPVIASEIYDSNSIKLNIFNTPENDLFKQSFSNNFNQHISKSEYVPGQIIVKFKDNSNINFYTSSEKVLTTGLETLDKLNIAYGLTHTEKIIEDDSTSEFSNVHKLCFKDDIDVLSVVKDYNNNQYVEFAEPNYLYHFDYIPNDEHFSKQWALNQDNDHDIDAPEAWDITMGDDDVVVAVLDTGVDYTNPDLGGCNRGITEIEYNLESKHPATDGNSFDVSIPGYLAVSLHFEKIDLGEKGNLYVYDAKASNPLNIKTLLSWKPGSYVTDFWTTFTEFDPFRNAKIHFDYYGGWGWKIDKIRVKTDQISLSSQSDKFVDGYDFVYNDNDPMDDHGHGTHCAGIIAATIDNAIGIAGVASNCKIMPVRILGKSSRNLIDLINTCRGIIYAVDNGADIISMSFSGLRSDILEDVLDDAYEKGCVLVSSAGNHDFNAPKLTFPASYDRVIGVGATDRNDYKTVFSCYGSSADVAAPGLDILSLRAYATDMYGDGTHIVDDNYYYASGTSMACPIVAGVAALVLSKNPDLTVQEVYTILRSSTDPLPVDSDKYIGTGRINAHTALTKAAPVIAEFDKSMHDVTVEGNFEIKGLVSKKGSYPFEFFIEYGEGIYPSTWNVIKHATSPQDGVLYSWNTMQVNDGPYVLRLRVIYNGFTYEDRVFVMIDNFPNTYYVDDVPGQGPNNPAEDYNKIQDAVDICGNKDTIFVYNGNYNDIIKQESGRLAKIVGENVDSTIIQFQEKIEIFNGGLSIEKCTINSGGIVGYPTLDCKILDNKFIDIGRIGIYNLEQSYYLKTDIQRNNFINSGSIMLVNCYDCKISENIIAGDIALESCNRITISENQITGGEISTIYSNNIDIMDNIISGGNDDGIDIIGEDAFNKICNNDIKDKWTGIQLDKSIKSCSNNIISGNKISNVYYGIYLGDPDNYHPDLGISPIPSCSYNEISKNEITNSKIGIFIIGSDDNTITQNNISYNTEYGLKTMNSIYGGEDMHIFYSKNNKIYLNNFIENGNPSKKDTGNAYDEGYNIWYSSDPLKGNYWSDYTGVDTNGDGIGETPYIIPGPGNNHDDYPLMSLIDINNNAPDKPATPSGKSIIKAGISYPYKTSTTDPDGDHVYYKWDWGDGKYSNWLGPYASEETASASHTWQTKGSYKVKVKAKDEHGAESPWSDPLPLATAYEEELTAKLKVSPNNVIKKGDCQKTFDASDSLPKDVLNGPKWIRWDCDGDGYYTKWQPFLFHPTKTIDFSYLFNNNNGIITSTTTNPTDSDLSIGSSNMISQITISSLTTSSSSTDLSTINTNNNQPTGPDSSNMAKKFYFAKVQIMNSQSEISTASIQMTIDYTNNNNNDNTPDQTQEETIETSITIEQANNPINPVNPTNPTDQSTISKTTSIPTSTTQSVTLAQLTPTNTPTATTIATTSTATTTTISATTRQTNTIR